MHRVAVRELGPAGQVPAEATAPLATPTPVRPRGFEHAPGLDGIRALAVAAVVTYHLGTTGVRQILPGGFLGVDVFFVLSGYLITSLLIVERRRSGAISIGQFYLRRARRLLPALFSLLLTVGLVGAYWLPQQAARLRGDLVAALGYVTNWWLIGQNSTYFAATSDRPDLLTHLWSLAVEEQYYLIWPVLLIIFARLRAPRGVLLTAILAGVAASTVAGVLLFDPFSDPSRVYYGTDTRALAPLLGSALAVAVQPWRHRHHLRVPYRLSLDLLGLSALVGLVGIALVLNDTDPELYQGGFLVIAALAAVLVAVAGHPATGLGRLLGRQPLRWLGDRSYAIYLWHWPVCVLTRPTSDVPVTGWANTALRVVIMLALAEASYWLIERPIRRHGFLGRARRARAVSGPTGVYTGRRRVGPAAAIRAVALSLILVGGGSVAAVQLASAASRPVAGGPLDLGPEATLGPLESPTPGPSVTASTAPATPPPTLPKGAMVAFFGDSQGMTLLLNKPADLGRYIKAVDATIEGCGVLLGKVSSRSGEKHNLTTNCRNWQPEWESDVKRLKPAVSVIMIGAWDVFDLTLDSGTLTFGSPGWDANFTAQITRGVDTLREVHTQVALSLLPCYRPIKASAGFWPERGDDERTRHVNDLLRAVAATYPDVATLDPPEEFCTTPSIGRNTAYRWDGVHYYKKGAALYFKAVLPQLLRLGT